METKLKKTCPKCLRVCFAVSGVEEDTIPVSGDIIVCGYCNGVLTFDDELNFIAATAEDIADCNLVDLQQAHKFINESR